MKKLLGLLFGFFFSFIAFAQPFQVGHTTITFNDPLRTGGFGSGGGTGRQIQTEIYYPATTAGNNTAVASGSFPVYVFGHGFVMTWDSYQPIYEELARQGFIVALPRTEGGISNSHTDFGKDMALISEKMVLLNVNNTPSALFVGKINGKRAIGGHSMGGGCTYLAAQYTTGLSCMLTLGAADTNPSAIAIAPTITVPNLVVSGSYDCVAPTATHQTPIYNGLGSSCKQYISITQAYHCQFSNSNFNCNFGEGTCITTGGISRADQLNKTLSIMIPYLNYYLKNDCAAWTTFNNLMTTSTWLTYQNACNQALTMNPTSTSVCPGVSTNLTANAPNSVGYVWSTGATTAAISVVPTTTTTYTVTSTNPQGCTTTISSTVTVNAVSPAIAGSNSVCNGSSLTLTASGGASYNWSTGNTTAAVNVSPTSATTYTVTVTNAAGCTATTSKAVSINALPTASITGNSSVCNGSTLALTATGGTSYNWSNGNTSAAINVAPTSATTYTVTATDSNGCTATANKSVTINSTPAASVSGNNSVCTGAALTLTASGGGSYLWSTGVTTSTVTVSPTSATTYIVTVTNASGCTATSNKAVSVNAVPNISTTGSTSICTGANATLSASGGNTYLWSNGLSGSSINVSPTTATTYTVTATDSNGCTGTSSATVNITASPTASITGTINICNGSSTTLSASGGNTYLWSNGSTTSSLVLTPTATTSYTVTTSVSGTCTATASTTITVNQNPTTNITGNTTLCNGASTTLQASGGSSYNWSDGSNGNSITVSPTTNTIYTVTATDSNGCTAVSTQNITVNANPTAVITGNTTLCNGASTTLQASGGNSYNWSDGSNGNSITVNPTTNTVYTVTATDSNGCTAVSSQNITVNANPTAVITGNTTLCNGASTTLQASGGNSYNWSDGSNGNSITVSPTTNTVYTVTATDSNGCTAVSSQNITVNANPTAVITGNTTLCNGASTTLQASGGNTYNWSDGSNGNSITVSPTANTTYTVTATDGNGCTAVSSQNIDVLSVPTPTILVTSGVLNTQTFGTYQWYFNGTPIAGATNQSYVPTQNGDYTVEVSSGTCNGTSNAFNVTFIWVEIAREVQAMIYPNPASDRIFIQLTENAQIQSSSVFSLNGQQMMSFGTTNELDIQALPKGMYLLKIETKDNGTAITRFVKSFE